VRRRLLAALLYFPVRGSAPAPPGVEDVWFDSADGERLHGWWVAAAPPKLGQVLFCSGNAGSVADRLPYAQLLAAAGFDVLLFDYRGYGRSSGRPSEEGTYADARAAREALLARPDAGAGRLLVAGESLGGAVALKLAVEHPPAGVLLQSTFTSVRDVAAVHYGFVPRSVVPDAYPSVRIVGDLRAPLLVLHGDRDEIVPVEQGRALYEAAPEPRRLRVLAGRGHNDLLGRDGSDWIDAIASWVREDVLGAGG
jgi:hypothetical protein